MKAIKVMAYAYLGLMVLVATVPPSAPATMSQLAATAWMLAMLGYVREREDRS